MGVTLRKLLGEIVAPSNETVLTSPILFEKLLMHKLPTAIRVIAAPPEQRLNFNCFVYALGLHTQEDFLGNIGWKHSQRIGDSIDGMIRDGILVPKERACAFDLIFYRSKDNTISHAGRLISEDYVISKWSWGPLILHKTWDVPDHYGDRAEYYECKKEQLDEFIKKFRDCCR